GFVVLCLNSHLLAPLVWSETREDFPLRLHWLARVHSALSCLRPTAMNGSRTAGTADCSCSDGVAEFGGKTLARPKTNAAIARCTLFGDMIPLSLTDLGDATWPDTFSLLTCSHWFANNILRTDASACFTLPFLSSPLVCFSSF